MDSYDLELLRVVELTIQNPKVGSPAGMELERLIDKTLRVERATFPLTMHPVTGISCVCAVLCGGSCDCWCHPGGTS